MESNRDPELHSIVEPACYIEFNAVGITVILCYWNTTCKLESIRYSFFYNDPFSNSKFFSFDYENFLAVNNYDSKYVTKCQ